MNAILEFITKILQLITSIFTLLKTMLYKCSGEIKNNHFNPKKIIILIILIVLIILMAFIILGPLYKRNSNVNNTTNSYPSHNISNVAQNNETKNNDVDNSDTFNDKSNNIHLFDIKGFHENYYDDPLISEHNLPLSDCNTITDVCTKFLTLDGIQFTINSNLDDADNSVHELLVEASRLEESETTQLDFSKCKQTAELRAKAYDLFHNNDIARLAGNDYYNLFLLASGAQQKFEFAKNSIQYFIRSILLSEDNNKNISYCAMSIGNTYFNLASEEAKYDYKIMLYQEAMLYLLIAKNYYSDDLNFSLYSVYNLLGITYYKLFLLYKSTGNKNLIEYMYNESYRSYENALSDISKLDPKDENQYRKNMELLRTSHEEYLAGIN